MSEISRTPDLVDHSVAACTEDGAWRSGWLGVLWEDEHYGYADVQVTSSAGAEIVFTVFWEDGLRPMYRIDVSPDGQEMFVLKNYDGWLDEIGLISYDDDGNPLDQDGEPVDPDDVDPFQVVNTAVASDEDAVLIAELMQGPPFAVEEIFTRMMAVVGNLTAYTDRWAHRYLRNSTAEDGPARSNLWRPVDIGNSATSFPIKDVDAGPVVRRVGADDWRGFHLVEEKISALVDDLGHVRSPPLSAEGLKASYVGKLMSIDELPDPVQDSWYRIWNKAHVAYRPMMS